MSERIPQNDFYKLQPILPQSLAAIGEAANASGLEANLMHLVTIRASQLNGCGFCLHMHHNEARRDGERQERLDVLPAWREMSCFSQREQAALLWTEALTLIAQGQVTDEIYENVSANFSEQELANLTAAIIAINGWNRIVAAMGFMPVLDK